jgi:hypothetical protein
MAAHHKSLALMRAFYHDNEVALFPGCKVTGDPFEGSGIPSQQVLEDLQATADAMLSKAMLAQAAENYEQYTEEEAVRMKKYHSGVVSYINSDFCRPIMRVLDMFYYSDGSLAHYPEDEDDEPKGSKMSWQEFVERQKKREEANAAQQKPNHEQQQKKLRPDPSDTRTHCLWMDAEKGNGKV